MESIRYLSQRAEISERHYVNGMSGQENRKKFEVKMQAARGGGIQKAIFIDDQLLDWQIDMNSYIDAMKMGPQFRREIQRDIEHHFVDSVSDFLGRKVTINDIKEAIKTGWI